MIITKSLVYRILPAANFVLFQFFESVQLLMKAKTETLEAEIAEIAEIVGLDTVESFDAFAESVDVEASSHALEVFENCLDKD